VLAHAPRQPRSWLTWDVRQMKIILRIAWIAFAALGIACSTSENRKAAFSVDFHVVDAHVVVDSVRSEFAVGSKEYEAAIYWYQRAFDEALRNAKQEDKHLEIWHFSKDAKGRAAEVGCLRGELDAGKYLKNEANQAVQHNDPSCHESCLRTLRASRGRG